MFGVNTFPDQTARRIYMGLRTTEMAFADECCAAMREVTTLSGSVPVETDETNLGRLDDLGLAPGAEAIEHGGEGGFAEYNCKEFVGPNTILDRVVADYEAYGEDALAKELQRARMRANLKLDGRLAQVLADTGLNETYSATGDGSGAWDTALGKPLLDLNTVRLEIVPGADTVIFDAISVNWLVQHASFTAQSSFYADGQIDYSAFAAYVKSKTEFKNVYVFNKFYNAAKKGQPKDVQYLFRGKCWVGHKSNLVLVDPAHKLQNHVDVERKTSKRGWFVQVTRHCDILRPSQSLGCYISGVLTP